MKTTKKIKVNKIRKVDLLSKSSSTSIQIQLMNSYHMKDLTAFRILTRKAIFLKWAVTMRVNSDLRVGKEHRKSRISSHIGIRKEIFNLILTSIIYLLTLTVASIQKEK